MVSIHEDGHILKKSFYTNLGTGFGTIILLYYPGDSVWNYNVAILTWGQCLEL